MANVKVHIFICIAFSVGVKGSLVLPCKTTDKACMLASANALIPKLAPGIPRLGVASSDPLPVPYINGDLSTLKFVFKNMTITGFTNCKAEDLDLNLIKSNLRLVLVCPNTQYVGDYTISGRLIVLPVEGTGDFVINAQKYKYVLNVELKQFQGKDGKQYISLKNFKGDAEALEPIVFDFRNLFNGRKVLSDAVHKFANDNYRDISEFAYAPLYGPVFRELFKNVNKFLKQMPMDEFILQ